MGSRGRGSCNGRKRSFPHEGLPPSPRIHLLAEAGSGSGVRLHQRRRPSAVFACLVALHVYRLLSSSSWRESNGTVLATRSALTGSNRPVPRPRTAAQETVVRRAV